MPSFTVSPLCEENMQAWLMCLETWNAELYSERKRVWYDAMKDKGLGVQIAEDEAGTPVGFIQYLPAQLSFVEGGEGLYLIQCIWVHGYGQGPGNRQGQGMGSALLAAAEYDVRSRDAAGLIAWGMDFPEWMPVAFYTKHGYREVDRQGPRVMAVKYFNDHGTTPRFIRPKKTLESIQEQTTVDVFCNGWCQSMNVLANFACDLARERGCVLREYTDNSLSEWGMDGEVYLNGDALDLGCPDGKAVIRDAFDKIK